MDRLDSRLKLAGMTNHSDLTNDVLDPSWDSLGMFSPQDDNPFLCCHPEQDSFKSVSAKDLVRGSLSSCAIPRLSSPNVFAGDPVDRLDSRLKLAGMTNHSDLTNDVLAYR